MNTFCEQYKAKFEKVNEEKQIDKVKKLIEKYNKLAKKSWFLEDNRNDPHKVNWSVVEIYGQKIPFTYDDRLWVIAMHMEQRITRFQQEGY